MLRPLPKHVDLWTDEEFIKAHGEAVMADPSRKPYYLGDLQRPGWTGRIPTYLVWCQPCRYAPNGGFTVAHEAGYARRLECSVCRARYDHLLPSRIAKDALLNPHRHPRFLMALILGAILAAIAFR